ncbi:MAG: hypothetical protein ACM3YN_00975 [Parcubacteria group bacterium]
MSAPGALTPATEPAPKPQRLTRRTYARRAADVPAGLDPGVVAEAIVGAVASGWDVGTWGQFDAAWLPSIYGPPEAKFVALISAIDAATHGVKLQLDRPANPSTLTITRPGRAPVVYGVEIARRTVHVMGIPAFSMASPGVARRLLEALAAKLADITAQDVGTVH